MKTCFFYFYFFVFLAYFFYFGFNNVEIIGEVAKGSSETTVGKNLIEVNLRENRKRGNIPTII